MRIDLMLKRPIRTVIFIGTLAGSLFSSSSAFADIQISSQSDLAAIGVDVGKPLDGNYFLTDSFAITETTSSNSYVMGTFTGTFDGNGKTISNLAKPLFDSIQGDGLSRTISDLNLIANSETGIIGNGHLGNRAYSGSSIENVHSVGNVFGSSFVGGLVGDTFSNAVIINSSAIGGVIGTGDFVGGLVGHSGGDVSGSFATGDVSSNGGYVGGLLGYANSIAVTNSYAQGNVSGLGTWWVGGLVGYAADGSITNSYATGNVSGNGEIGGLVGKSVNGEITNSYATGNVSGDNQIGGLVGEITDGEISNTFALGNISVDSYIGGGIVGSSYSSLISNSIANGNVTGLVSTSQLGGIAGYAEYSTIEDVAYKGDISGSQNIGGLVGYVGLNTEITRGKAVTDITSDSYAGGVTGSAESGFRLNNTQVTANIQGNEVIGGLVGYARGTSAASDIQINNSYWKGNLTSTFGPNHKASAIAYAQRTDDSTSSSYYINYTVEDPLYSWFAATIDGNNVVGRVNAPEWFGSVDIPNPTSMLQGFATQRVTGNTWAICSSINQSNPYLISFYPNNPCQDTNVRRSSVEPESREQVKLKPSSAIEKTLGFKNDRLFPNSAAISFVNPREQIDIDKVKSVEIAPTVNVKVSAKTDEALQISLKSESKEPVELWVKFPDGKWLLAGVITFNKDGKAVLPPLQFKSAGDFTLALNKPTAGSAKGSEPLNQSGSLLVEVI